MAFESKTYELITPESGADSGYEDHEYLLCWFGRTGAFYQYMFTDRETSVDIDAEVINERDQDEIKSLVTGERRSVQLTAEDLSKNDLSVIGSLLSTERIIRLKKDSSFEYVAIESNSYRYRGSDGRYNLNFSIRLWNLK